MKKYNIAHVGAFDMENYGDLLFPKVLESHLENRVEIENITLFAPKKIKMPFAENVQVFSVLELEEKCRENMFDAIIIGGGDLVHLLKIPIIIPAISKESIAYEPIYLWTIPAMVASKYNIPLIWNCPGVPRVFYEEERLLIKELVDAVDYISVRDYPSRENLLQCGVEKEIHVYPDSVLSISDIIDKQYLENVLAKKGLQLGERYVVFQCGTFFEDGALKLCADMLKKINDIHGYKVVLMPIGYALNDMAPMMKIYERFPDDFVFIKEKLAPVEMMSVIASASCYIGSSLHGCITAVSYHTPEIVCNYNHYNKVTGFFELIGHERYLVDKPEEIYTVFEKGLERDFAVVDDLKGKIEEHFLNITDIMEREVKDKTNTPLTKGFLDYANTIHHRIEDYNDDIKKNREEIMELEKKCAEYNRTIGELSSALDEMTKSTCWKITKPLRVLLDMVKK